MKPLPKFAALVLIAGVLVAGFPPAAYAHNTWIRPSATVVSGSQPWITFDAAVSNDLFYFNHQPLRLNSLQIVAPDGSALTAENEHTGRYRSVFDLQLQQEGTYRIAIVNRGMFASWEENGEARRWRGSAESFSAEVPASADKLKVVNSSGRIETFVTRGAPTVESMKPGGRGLELVPVTHPNDLFAGETASFKLLLDGEPAVNVEVTVIPGDTRYRDSMDEMITTTDATGAFQTTWPAAGMYWLEASMEDDKASEPATSRRASYNATLEVLPQ